MEVGGFFLEMRDKLKIEGQLASGGIFLRCFFCHTKRCYYNSNVDVKTESNWIMLETVANFSAKYHCHASSCEKEVLQMTPRRIGYVIENGE